MLALVVSGGHTQLVMMHDHCVYDIVGQTQDDAVGRHLTKWHAFLNLATLAAPAIATHADAFTTLQRANPFALPRPMLQTPGYDFSFSGLKTAVLYTVKEFRATQQHTQHTPLPPDFVNAVAHAFQEAACDV